MKGYLRAPFVNIGAGSAEITIKFQSIDTTTGDSVEKVMFHESANPWTGNDYDGEYEGTMDIPLYQNHDYVFVLYAEAYADATGVAPGISDFGGVLYPSENSRIEWRYMDVPNIGGSGGGGCPWVYTWNGTGYDMDNNLIPAAEHSNGTDVTDHYLLQQPLVQEDGKYSLLILDSSKHSFLDKAQLIAIDHESDIKVAPSPDGEILTYSDPKPTMKAFNSDGENVSHLLQAADGQSYQGSAGDYLVLDFAGMDIRDGAKLVVRSDLPCDPWCYKSPVYFQVINTSGDWQTVSTIYTRLYWAIDIIDLSEHWPDTNGEPKVRVFFTSNDKIDFIGLDTSKQAEFEINYANLVSAIHSNGANMKEVLKYSDNLYVELYPVEQIKLDYTLPHTTEDQRDFIIILERHYFAIS